MSRLKSPRSGQDIITSGVTCLERKRRRISTNRYSSAVCSAEGSTYLVMHHLVEQLVQLSLDFCVKASRLDFCIGTFRRHVLALHGVKIWSLRRRVSVLVWRSDRREDT